MFPFKRKPIPPKPPKRPYTILVVQGRDIWVRGSNDSVRATLTAAWKASEPARFTLYNGDGDVLIHEAQIGAIFLNSRGES